MFCFVELDAARYRIPKDTNIDQTACGAIAITILLCIERLLTVFSSLLSRVTVFESYSSDRNNVLFHAPVFIRPTPHCKKFTYFCQNRLAQGREQ